MLFLILSAFMLFSLHAESPCPDTERQYILGDYKKCAVSKENGASTQCSYIKALCSIGNNNLDEAKYPLSILSVEESSTHNFTETNGLALASLVEIAYLAGDYKKAQNLSGELNSLLSKKLPDSYPYMVSEVLLAKSYYNNSDSRSAKKRLVMLELTSMDPILYYSINP